MVENRAGAGGSIAGAAVARAAPDGYTVLLATGSLLAINVSLYKNLGYDPEKDFEPITVIGTQTNVLYTHPSVPAKSLGELIDYARANPGKLTFGSGGIGTPAHLAGELLKAMTGVNMVHVPYRGQAPAMTDLLAGQVQVMFDPVVSSIAHIRAGKLRPLAVTTSTRSEALPDIPTVGEFLPGYEASVWFGAGVPKNTPTEIVDKLNKEINAALTDAAFKARLVDMGGTVLSGSPAEFGKLIAEETEKWARVIKFANIKAV